MKKERILRVKHSGEAMETGLGKSLGSWPRNRLQMSLEKLASAKLGKARVREERNSSGGGEGHK